MKKRSIYIIILALLLLSVPFLITLIFFQSYRNVVAGLTMFLFVGVQWFANAKRRKAVKRKGESLSPWWKDYLVVLALTFGCYGMFECLIGLSSNIKSIDYVFMRNLEQGFSALFFFLAVGLAFYGLTLMRRHFDENKQSRHSQ